MSLSQSMLIRQVGRAAGRRPDDLAVEEPLLIRVNGADLTTTMRTPGHDFELAAGLCVAEGVLPHASVRRISYETVSIENDGAGPADLTAVNVVTDRPDVRLRSRLALTSTACGLCGHRELDGLIAGLRPLDVDPWDDDLLVALPGIGLADQPLFTATGATHSAALVDRAGRRWVTREDVGRHNAVDKVIGHAVLEGLLDIGARGSHGANGLSGTEVALVVSGRASFEIVHKAWAAGVGAVVAVSAPTALAVTSARRAGMILAGFVGEGQANVYSPAP